MRIFIAAELPRPLIEALAETQAELRAHVPGRFVGTHLFHITLAFLGNVDTWRIADIEQALETACKKHEAFNLTLSELGSFGKKSKAALWQGFRKDEGYKALEALANEVRRALQHEGFSFDDKRFLGHITLMRNADLGQLEGALLPMPVVETGCIDTVSLLSSDLSGPQPVHEALCRCNLAQD